MLLRRRARRHRGQQAAAKGIDTGPLRSIDGNFKLVAATLISPPLRIGNADLAATLKDGVLTISHFKGSLYGGSLDFSGVVNASQPALAVDLKGDATGIRLGEMLRSTRGSNQFGSSIKVTIDGRLNATGIAVRAGGTTSDQLRSSLAGGANLGGHIFVGADEALQVHRLGPRRRRRRRDRQHARHCAGHRRPARPQPDGPAERDLSWSSIASSIATTRSAATSTSPVAC